ncbi:hypothetical protein PCASD_23220 [Puccinia coronata f. sp. avenae]|uniref:Uncharacterized protein n=1 Tax=Puccinia coronata f. sp. avenae TaxID=200324 RepID=A0A2N5SPG4_9BASI|nr:hypothetical protein PCASD_23220 [Puccinia coronata f. sp. avenae]
MVDSTLSPAYESLSIVLCHSNWDPSEVEIFLCALYSGSVQRPFSRIQDVPCWPAGSFGRALIRLGLRIRGAIVDVFNASLFPLHANNQREPPADVNGTGTEAPTAE